MNEDLTGLINGNHQRTISTVLALVDQAHFQFRQWAEGYCAQGVLDLERNTLSASQRHRSSDHPAATHLSGSFGSGGDT